MPNVPWAARRLGANLGCREQDCASRDADEAETALLGFRSAVHDGEFQREVSLAPAEDRLSALNSGQHPLPRRYPAVSHATRSVIGRVSPAPMGESCTIRAHSQEVTEYRVTQLYDRFLRFNFGG